MSDPTARDDITALIANIRYLEEALGETLEPADAAHVAGIERRWSAAPPDVDAMIERLNEIAASEIITPAGRGAVRDAADLLARMQVAFDRYRIESLTEQLATEARVEALTAERDEATNWSDIVDRHGTDGFDDLAEAWLGLDAIKRVTNAVTSIFSKWANDELMERFRKHQLSMFHMAFVEGCLAGVKAEKSGAEARRTTLETKLLGALRAAKEHLDYCGYGDDWERAARPELEQLIDAAVDAAEKKKVAA